MNYSEQLKQLETKVTNLKAQALAKKKTIEEEIENRKKLEEECKSKFGISLTEVSERIKTLTNEIELSNTNLTKEVENIETEFENIK